MFPGVFNDSWRIPAEPLLESIFSDQPRVDRETGLEIKTIYDHILSRRAKKNENRHAEVNFQCECCGPTHTPEKRTGPSGPKTLCNACGLLYNHLVRQARVKRYANQQVFY